MTWLKLGEEFTRETGNAGLSDAAFRTHVEALAYAVDRETDGVINRRDVRRFADSDHADTAVQELLDGGFWATRVDGALQIVHHLAEQPSADYLKDKRSNDAIRQQRYREKKALVAQGHSDDEIEAILQGRGVPEVRDESQKPKTTRKSGAMSQRDKARDVTRDPERNGAERSGTELHSLNGEGSTGDMTDEQKKRDTAWLAGVPVNVPKFDKESYYGGGEGLSCAELPHQVMDVGHPPNYSEPLWAAA